MAAGPPETGELFRMHLRLLLITADNVLRNQVIADARWLPVRIFYARDFAALRSHPPSPSDSPSAVIVDLENASYREGLAWVRANFPDARALFVRKRAHAAEAGLGATSFLPRPVEPYQFARSIAFLMGEHALQVEPRVGVGGLESLIGRSLGFRAALESAMRAAPDVASPVLIQGERGTGKSVFARAIAAESGLSGFAEVDCAALSGAEAAEEIFGIAPGTRPSKPAPGGILGSERPGTVFLDNIERLTLPLQRRLLEYMLAASTLAEHAGSMQASRVIAATETDLERVAKAGGFSQELLGRLSTYRIVLPPLRERPSDVLLLAEQFLTRQARLMGRSVPTLAPDAQEILLASPWPGNVAELFDVLMGALLRLSGERIEGAEMRELLHEVSASAPAPPTEDLTSGGAFGAAVDARGGRVVVYLPEEGIAFEEIEKAVLSAALEHTKGNVVRAARFLRMGRGSLRYRLEKFGLAQPRRRRRRTEESEGEVRQAS